MIRLRTETLTVVLFGTLLLTQCSENPVSPLRPVPPFRVSMEIDQHGGILALEREAWVIVPPGAVDSALTFTITRKPSLPNLPPNYRRSGYGYDFEPHGCTFNKPVKVSIACDPGLVNPSIAKLDDENDRFWELQQNAIFSYKTASTEGLALGLFVVAEFHALDSVYVSTSSQGSNAAGTADDPLPSLRSAIEASLAAGEPYPTVFVAQGTYAESGLTLAGGVSVLGGYNEETWLPIDGIRSIVEVDSLPVYAAGIAESTTVSALEIRIGNATDRSANSVALHLVSCTSRLVFVRCRFVAGNGADGADGAIGDRGGNGGAGGGGVGESPGEGGFGCYRGGRGGYGTYEYRSLWSGFSGEGPEGGQGGGSGWTLGLDGGQGGDGGNGANGGGGTSSGTATVAGWEPNPGTAGTNGACGSGGGGGAGNATWILLEIDGGGGGGGGAGGYGGGGGKGGDGGGSSFAVYLYESSPVFDYCEFLSGDGGDGGNGGNGNVGGTGGAGGIGGSANWRTGGKGGAGGDGGDGGGGQGGPGGHSYCVYRAGSISLNAILIFPECTFGSPGVPGSGGFHGSEGARAVAGAQGESGAFGP